MIRFVVRKPSQNVDGIDHNNLLNKGVNTHEQIDLALLELADARGTNLSIGEKISKLTLGNLSDVDTKTTAIKNGQVLSWDATKQKYIPADSGSGGGGFGGGKPFNLAITYNLDGTVNTETYTGTMDKVVSYTYIDGNISVKTVVSDGVKTSNFFYDADGNLISVQDTGTSDLIESVEMQMIQSQYMRKVREIEKNAIKMQFKYDIILNLVKNYCSDFFIDVLQDVTNVESFFNSAYISASETIS